MNMKKMETTGSVSRVVTNILNYPRLMNLILKLESSLMENHIGYVLIEINISIQKTGLNFTTA